MILNFLCLVTTALVTLFHSIPARSAESPFWDANNPSKNMINGYDNFNNEIRVSDIEAIYGKNLTRLIVGQLHHQYTMEQIESCFVGVNYALGQLAIYQIKNGVAYVIALIPVSSASLSNIQKLAMMQNAQETKIAKTEVFKQNIQNGFDQADASQSIGDKFIPGVSFYSGKQSDYNPYQPTGTREKDIGAKIQADDRNTLFFEATSADSSLVPEFQTQSATIGLINKISSRVSAKIQLTKVQSPLGTIPTDTVIMSTVTIRPAY